MNNSLMILYNSTGWMKMVSYDSRCKNQLLDPSLDNLSNILQ